jgi:hypothetical protein
MAKPRKAEKHMIIGKPILKVGGSNFKAPAMTAPLGAMVIDIIGAYV